MGKAGEPSNKDFRSVGCFWLVVLGAWRVLGEGAHGRSKQTDLAHEVKDSN